MIRYELRTAKGAPICAYDDLASAVAAAKDALHAFPGLRIVRVTYPPPTEHVVWTEARFKPAVAA
jgi:hypothetical protein